jgi:hypothetical protein
MTVQYEAGDKTFQEMYAMFQSPEFRQPCEMCIRRQASFQSLSDKPVNAALANGVLGNSSMDLEALIGAVATDPEGHLTIGNDAKMFEIVEKVWPLVAQARYQGVVNNPPQIVYTTLPPPTADPQSGVITFPPPKEGAAPVPLARPSSLSDRE